MYCDGLPTDHISEASGVADVSNVEDHVSLIDKSP